MDTELPEAGRVAEALERVYSRSAFQSPEPGPLASLRETIADLLRRPFDRLYELLSGQGDNPVVFWSVLAVLTAAGAAIVAYFLVQTLSRLSAPTERRHSASSAGSFLDARARTPEEWEEQARRLAGDGRFRDAALALYQALLLRLEAAGVVRYHPSKTPGDYRREARPHPRAGTLTAFLRGFEPVAFGGRDPGADGYERLWSTVREAASRA